jgi:hypothetical protein
MSRTPSQVIRSPGLPRGRETVHLKSSRFDVDERDGYLHIVAIGILSSLEQVAECNAAFSRLMSERGTRRALLDARGQQGEPPPEVRAAVWDWFKSDRAFETVAYVVPESEGMKAARINMTAVALGMNLRAFVSVIEAHRFLSPKRGSSMFPAVREGDGGVTRAPSSFPPPLEVEVPRGGRMRASQIIARRVSNTTTLAVREGDALEKPSETGAGKPVNPRSNRSE